MVTIWDVAELRGVPADCVTLGEFEKTGLPMFGGCKGCGASIAAYNAYPARDGYLRCKDCIGLAGYETAAEAHAALFPEDTVAAITAAYRARVAALEAEEGAAGRRWAGDLLTAIDADLEAREGRPVDEPLRLVCPALEAEERKCKCCERLAPPSATDPDFCADCEANIQRWEDQR